MEKPCAEEQRRSGDPIPVSREEFESLKSRVESQQQEIHGLKAEIATSTGQRACCEALDAVTCAPGVCEKCGKKPCDKCIRVYTYGTFISPELPLRMNDFGRACNQIFCAACVARMSYNKNG